MSTALGHLTLPRLTVRCHLARSAFWEFPEGIVDPNCALWRVGVPARAMSFRRDLLRVGFASTDPIADATTPIPSGLRVYFPESVFGGVLMAIRAVSLRCIQMKTCVDATSDILSLRDRLKMIGAHATRRAAKVVEDKTAWNSTNKQRVGNAMSRLKTLLVGNLPVPKGVCGALPKPAAFGLLNLRPKAGFDGWPGIETCRHSASIIAAIPPAIQFIVVICDLDTWIGRVGLGDYTEGEG